MKLVKILTLSNGLWFGSAQISILEFLELLHSEPMIDLRMTVCRNGYKKFVHSLRSFGPVYEVSCYSNMGYPVMAVDEIESLVKEVDLVWITDVEFLAAPRVKRIRRDVLVVAHLRSHALICPWWAALYGFRDVCMEGCSAWRITRCKQGINMELTRIGVLSRARANLYYFLDFAKGPVEYARWRSLMRGVLESIDGFIAVSRSLWDTHVAHIPELKGKPHAVIYNPVTLPLKYVEPDPNEPYGDYILYASGTNPVKGPHILLDAWSQPEREYPEIKLVMIGCRGSWVEDKARRLGLKNVVFLDKMPPTRQYYNIMYEARAVIMPSIVPEAFGRIPVEANRLRVPAIASNRGGLVEIVEPGVSGEIWGCCSPNTLAEAIEKVLQRRWSREEIMKHVNAKFDPNKIRDSIISFFKVVANA